MKFKILLEYDGTGYSGWQKQKNAKSIQGTLIDAVYEIFKSSKAKNEFIDLQGSGRTDSGVHAYGQVAHLECQTMLGPEILKLKLNDILPSSINILDVDKADSRFHARHSAKSREYIYRIAKRRTAFEKKYVWWVKDKLNVGKMKECAALMVGMHDYISFTDKNNPEPSTKVLVESIEVSETPELIIIKIRASHFLWKMVRRVVGILAECGRAKYSQKDITRFLNSYSEEPAAYTAPPSGLFLNKVYY